jgi:ketosteroid isomerase-like protein
MDLSVGESRGASFLQSVTIEIPGVKALDVIMGRAGTAAVRCSLSDSKRDRRTLASELETEYARAIHDIFACHRVARWGRMYFRAAAGATGRIA